MKHDSMLQDTPRVEYIQAYIGAVLNAIKYGHPFSNFSPHVNIFD